MDWLNKKTRRVKVHFNSVCESFIFCQFWNTDGTFFFCKNNIQVKKVQWICFQLPVFFAIRSILGTERGKQDLWCQDLTPSREQQVISSFYHNIHEKLTKHLLSRSIPWFHILLLGKKIQFFSAARRAQTMNYIKITIVCTTQSSCLPDALDCLIVVWHISRNSRHFGIIWPAHSYRRALNVNPI